MNELMKAPLEGTVDIDPVFIEDMTNKVRDTMINDFIAFTVAGGTPAPLEGEVVRERQPPIRNLGEREVTDFALAVERQQELDSKTIEGELVDKGVEVTIYRDRPSAMGDFIGQSIERRRAAKKEIFANKNAIVQSVPLEGELIKARDPGAGSHKLEDLSGRNTLKHAIQEIETALEASHEISSTPPSPR